MAEADEVEKVEGEAGEAGAHSLTFIEKKSMCKWIHMVQTHVVQVSILLKFEAIGGLWFS